MVYEGWFTVKLFDNEAVWVCGAVAIVLLTVTPAVVAATFAVDNDCVLRKPLFATRNGAGLCERSRMTAATNVTPRSMLS
jgi:hypothetical protein